MTKIAVNFASADVIQKPNMSEVIIETGALLNINWAHVTSSGGEMVIDVPDDKLEDVVKSFEERGAHIQVLERLVLKDDEKCINCGACISMCPVGVYYYGDDWSVNVKVGVCVQCDLCVVQCPMGALELKLQD